MLRERELIELIAAGRAGAAPRRGDVGIGDDCAVIRAGGRGLLVTIDMMVEGVHFDLKYTPPYLLGRKAVAASLSDIAAMGGKPRAIFVSISIPKTARSGFARALIEGIHDEALADGAAVMGGDTTASPGPVVVDVAALGETSPRGPVMRSAARPREGLYVSGVLGGSAAGRDLLRRGFDPFSGPSWKQGLRALDRGRAARSARVSGMTASAGASPGHSSLAREGIRLLAAMAHLLPRPRLALGSRLAARGLASAMIDLSDGLSTDLHNLCDASRVGALIEAARIPLHPALTTGRAGAENARRAIARALSGGEDYELLFTAPARAQRRLAELSAGLAVPITRIGRIVPRARGVAIVSLDGRTRTLKRRGWEHFREP